MTLNRYSFPLGILMHLSKKSGERKQCPVYEQSGERQQCPVYEQNLYIRERKYITNQKTLKNFQIHLKQVI